MGIDDYLKTRRQSVRELADELGVTRQTVYNWIRGIYQPHFTHVVRLVRISDGRITKPRRRGRQNNKVQNMFHAAADLLRRKDDAAEGTHAGA